MRRLSPAVGWVIAWLVASVGLTGFALAGQMNPDEQALMVLESARRAYNEKNYPFTAERFREFLKQYGGHRDAPAAYYGLGLALLAAPQKDYPGAIQALQQVAGRGEFADQPFAVFYLATAQRSLGYQALDEAIAKPNEANNFRNKARGQFEEASRQFAAAAAAFTARAKTAPAPAPAPQPPELLEWAARARCDQCEMFLRLDRFKEAADLASAFLADPATAASRYRPLAYYHLGYASFAQKDLLAAGRALSQVAPFQQEYGVHARYLLARTHHLSDERPEATVQYKAVLADFEQAKKAAQAALGNPAALEPEQKAFLEGLMRNPPPDYILRASFYLALLACEEGRYADALAGFSALLQQYPKSSLAPEAQLRLGFCQLQLRNFPEAIKTLQPFCEHPQLADQALWWTARAQVGAADPKNADAYRQALAAALDLLRRAAERAAQLAQQNDPAAKARRGDIMIEMADTQQLAKQYKEAAATYQTAIVENANPERAEEALQRQATALHLAGMFKESDDACARFEKAYPRSTLLPAVWFRGAENAYQAAAAAAANPNLPNRPQELGRLFGEAISRYQRLIEKYPDFAYANLARHGMAMAHYQLGHYAEAIALLSAIPEVERNGDLASVSYLLADCLVRTLPTETDDALTAARLVDQATEAAKLLENYAAAQPQSPQTPDALDKLGFCYQRIASVMADPAERQKVLQQARGAYERLVQQFAKDPLMPVAAFGRATCQALLGDVGGAMNELNRFRGDPFRQSPIAPLALLRLGNLMRSQRQAAEAVKVLAQCREQFEAALLKDPARADWVPLLQYEHGLAVKETGKLPEARAIFDALLKQFPDHPAAVNAVWRAGQTRREELLAQLAAARQAAAKGGAKPEEIAAANQAVDAALKELSLTVASLQAQAAALGRKAPGSEPQLRMLYEIAWCYRALADAEIEAARQKLQREAIEDAQHRLAKVAPPNQPPPALSPPPIPLALIPVRMPEQAACDTYERLIAAAPAAPLAAQARLELAEMLAQRGNADAVARLLADALEKAPPPELADQARVRLAEALLAKDDAKGALGHVQPILRNPKNPLLPQAAYLAGEAYSRLQDWPKAIEQLVPFRDRGEFQNIPGLSDRALLALGRACANAGQWDPSRQAYEILAQRFQQSDLVDDALYGAGWAWQSQKQFDNAVNVYTQLTRRSAGEAAAKAQLQIGLCRLEQKRFPEAAQALAAVAYTYDYPDLAAQACCGAATAYLELKQPLEAGKLWRKVIKDYPQQAKWVQIAQQKLAEVKEATP